jgi:uncharacterized MAPEG superfamily protein
MDIAHSGELQMLVDAVVLGLIQIVLAAGAGAGGERSLAWLMGPRDDWKPVTGQVGQRLGRALANFLETFPLFAGAVLAVLLAGKSGPLSYWGSVLYLAGRAVYVPLYAMGVPVLRTLVWTASMVGIVLVIVAFFQ